jgi:hypothetical protein
VQRYVTSVSIKCVQNQISKAKQAKFRTYYGKGRWQDGVRCFASKVANTRDSISDSSQVASEWNGEVGEQVVFSCLGTKDSLKTMSRLLSCASPKRIEQSIMTFPWSLRSIRPKSSGHTSRKSLAAFFELIIHPNTRRPSSKDFCITIKFISSQPVHHVV